MTWLDPRSSSAFSGGVRGSSSSVGSDPTSASILAPCFWLLSLLVLLAWSAINPLDRFVWCVEALPAMVGVTVLAVTYHRFKFTRVVYVVTWIHAAVIIIAAHHTYAEMPLFNWIRDEFHLSRNYYDRVGHFLQGFGPALVARELLLRTSPLRRGKWMFFIVVCICLALSAFYELIEWWAAVAAGTDVNIFLGTQGDLWDTEWDMLMAMSGAIVAQVALGRTQDRGLQSKTHGASACVAD